MTTKQCNVNLSIQYKMNWQAVKKGEIIYHSLKYNNTYEQYDDLPVATLKDRGQLSLVLQTDTWYVCSDYYHDLSETSKRKREQRWFTWPIEIWVGKFKTIKHATIATSYVIGLNDIFAYLDNKTPALTYFDGKLWKLEQLDRHIDITPKFKDI